MRLMYASTRLRRRPDSRGPRHRHHATNTATAQIANGMMGSSMLLLFGVLVVGAGAPRACAFLSLAPDPISVRQSRLHQSSFDLTEDGDFLIDGIKGENSVGKSDAATTPNYLSALSLGSADSIGQISSANISEAVNVEDESGRLSTPQRDVGDFVGLNDDGDFLMVGINGVDPLEIATQDEEEDNDGTLPLAAQSIPFGLKLTSADDSIDMIAVQRFREQSDVSRIDQGARTKESAQPSHGSDDDEAVEAVGEWLSEIIPTLRDAENLRYSQELVAIGFDPGCVTQCELTWEDLSFMKLLHRRYLYNEITGQDHPWEA